jgi:uridine kinase
MGYVLIWAIYVQCSSILVYIADPRLTDYDLLLQNINDLKCGKAVDVPIYDFKLSCRTGYRLVLPP